MPYPIGRGVRLEVENALTAAKTVSAITLADPGVATSTAHAMANGTVGYFTGVTGMIHLEDQAIRVANQATNTFELLRYKTTGLPAFSGTASFIPVSTWFTVGNATQVALAGGEAAEIDQSVLVHDIAQIEAGLLSAQTVTVTGFSDFDSPAMLKIVTAAVDQTALTFRVTLKDGRQRIFRGTVGLPSEDLSVGQSATGSFVVRVRGRVMFLPAV